MLLHLLLLTLHLAELERTVSIREIEGLWKTYEIFDFVQLACDMLPKFMQSSTNKSSI